ncbi:hypothetical protein 1 [Beihai shrimp virus 1]|uniref:hypothetical protein 1 n=1 Tax=Beihai shrimp virus 1 TaxID=1922667 RepID=UPI00090A54D3|nr:hypothetical protein 1 [Beihai shrimp virus 1]APG76712.1 hypothetical protein 1 [Beihai shrimp virus 1]
MATTHGCDHTGACDSFEKVLFEEYASYDLKDMFEGVPFFPKCQREGIFASLMESAFDCAMYKAVLDYTKEVMAKPAYKMAAEARNRVRHIGDSGAASHMWDYLEPMAYDRKWKPKARYIPGLTKKPQPIRKPAPAPVDETEEKEVTAPPQAQPEKVVLKEESFPLLPQPAVAFTGSVLPTTTCWEGKKASDFFFKEVQKREKIISRSLKNEVVVRKIHRESLANETMWTITRGGKATISPLEASLKEEELLQESKFWVLPVGTGVDDPTPTGRELPAPPGVSYPLYAIWMSDTKARSYLFIEEARLTGNSVFTKSGRKAPRDAVLCYKDEDQLLEIFQYFFWYDTQDAVEHVRLESNEKEVLVNSEHFDNIRSTVSKQNREIEKLKKQIQRKAAHIQRELEKEKRRRKERRQAAADAKYARLEAGAGLLESVGQMFNAPTALNEAALDVSHTAKKWADIADSVQEVLDGIATTFASYTTLNLPDIFASVFLVYKALRAMDAAQVVASVKLLASSLGYGISDLYSLIAQTLSNYKTWFTADGNEEFFDAPPSRDSPVYIRLEAGFMDVLSDTVGKIGDSLSENGWVCMVISSILAFITFILSGNVPDFKVMSRWFSDFGRMSNGVKAMKDFYFWLTTQIEEIYYQHVCGKSLEEIKMIKQYPRLEQLIAGATFVSTLDLGPIDRCANVADQIINLRNELVSLKHEAMRSKDQRIAALIMDYLTSFSRQYLCAVNSPAKINKVREEPFALYVAASASGVGKTVLCELLKGAIHQRYIAPHGIGMGDACFTRRAGNEYWEGYNCGEGGHHIVYYDDFLQQADSSSTPNPEVMEVISMKNTAPYQLHMADISSKKDCYFRSRYLLFSSNLEKPNPQSIVKPEALRRRFDLGVKVAVRPECGKQVKTATGTYYRYDAKKTAAWLESQGMAAPTGQLSSAHYQLSFYNVESQEILEFRGKTSFGYDEFLEVLFEQIDSYQAKASALRHEILQKYGLTSEKQYPADQFIADQILEKIKFRYNAELLTDGLLTSPSEVLKKWAARVSSNVKYEVKHRFTDFKTMVKSYLGVQTAEELEVVMEEGRVNSERPPVEEEVETVTETHLTLQIASNLLDAEAGRARRSGQTVPVTCHDGEGRDTACVEVAVLHADDEEVLIGKTSNSGPATLQLHEETDFSAPLEEIVITDQFVPEIIIDPLARYQATPQNAIATDMKRDIVYSTYQRCMIGATKFRLSLMDLLKRSIKWVSEKAKTFYEFILSVFRSASGWNITRFGKNMFLTAGLLMFYDWVTYKAPMPTRYCGFWQTCEGAPCLQCKLCKDLHFTDENWEEDLVEYVKFLSSDAGQKFLGENSIFINRLFRWYIRNYSRVESGEMRTLGAKSQARIESIHRDTLSPKQQVRIESIHKDTLSPKQQARIEVEEKSLQPKTHARVEAMEVIDIDSRENRKNGFDILRVESDTGYEEILDGMKTSSKLFAAGDLVRVEQAKATVCRNCAFVQFTRKASVVKDGVTYNKANNGIATFIRGRIAIVNRHVIPKADDFLYVQVLNPWQANQPGRIPSEAVKISELSDAAGNPLDLALIEFPTLVASRPDITSKFARAIDMPVVQEGKLVLDGLQMQNGIPIMVTKTTPSFKVYPRVIPVEEGKGRLPGGFKYNGMLHYDLDTQNGLSGSILTASNPLLPAKIVGIHCGGIGAHGNGIGHPVSREFINRVLEEHIKKFNSPLVSRIDSAAPFARGECEQVEMPTVVLPKRGTCVHMGTAPKPTQPTKSSVNPSAIAGAFGPPTAAPALLAPFKMDGKMVEPNANASKKLLDARPYIDEKKLKRASKIACQMMGKAPANYKRVLTIEEAVTAEGIQEMTGIKRSTSKGYPSVLKGTCSNKRELLGTDEYIIDPELRRAVNNMITACKSGRKPDAIWQAMLKDERRPLAKVKAGKTRQIYASWIVLLIVMRMYFGGVLAWTHANRITNGCAIGVNPYSMEWQKIADHLQEVGCDIVSGDHENYDGQNNAMMVYGLLDIIDFHYDTQTDEERMVRTTLWDTIANADVLINGEVVRLDHSQPSGGFLTTWINCWSNIDYHIYIFNESKTRKGRHDLDFLKDVRIMTFGDDVLYSVSPAARDVFNFGTVRSLFQEIFHMNYTLETKSTEDVGYRTIYDVEFLKRTFRENEYGVITAPLNLKSIHEMVNWIRGKETIAATATNVQFAIRELYFHGEEVFDEHMEVLTRVCAEAGVPIIFKTWEDFSEAWGAENGFGQFYLNENDFKSTFDWEAMFMEANEVAIPQSDETLVPSESESDSDFEIVILQCHHCHREMTDDWSNCVHPSCVTCFLNMAVCISCMEVVVQQVMEEERDRSVRPSGADPEDILTHDYDCPCENCDPDCPICTDRLAPSIMYECCHEICLNCHYRILDSPTPHCPFCRRPIQDAPVRLEAEEDLVLLVEEEEEEEESDHLLISYEVMTWESPSEARRMRFLYGLGSFLYTAMFIYWIITSWYEPNTTNFYWLRRNFFQFLDYPHLRHRTFYCGWITACALVIMTMSLMMDWPL